MTQSELGEFEPSEGIECPKGCGNYSDLSVHWGMVHDEPFPTDVKKMTEETRCRLSEVQQGKTRSEEARRAISESKMGEANPMYGEPLSEDHRQKISEANTGKTHTEKTRRKIAEAHSGKTLSEDHIQNMAQSLRGNTRPPEVRQKISETLEGRTVSKETRRKLSEALSGRTISEEHRRALFEGHHATLPHRGNLCVVPTRHTVRNAWEKEIDLLLYNGGFDFEYEANTFEIGDGRKYTPDFKVDDNIIEVKGHVWKDADRRAELFMESHPEYRYIVVGTELPADEWIPWSNRDRLCVTLNNV